MWYNPLAPWRPYMPIATLYEGLEDEQSLYWALLRKEDDILERSDAPGEEGIDSSLADVIEIDYNTIQSVALFLIGVSPRGPPVPQHLQDYDSASLRNLRGRTEVEEGVFLAKGHMTEYIGLVTYLFLRSSATIQNRAKDLFAVHWKAWRLEGPKVGALVDLEDGMSVPLTELLTDGVPVYYPVPKLQPPMDLLPATRELRHIPASAPNLRFQPYARPDAPLSSYSDSSGSVMGKRPLTERLTENYRLEGEPLDMGVIHSIAAPKGPLSYDPFDQLDWSMALMDCAHLDFIPASEATLRLIRAESPVSFVTTVLSDALTRGIEFRLLLPADFVPRALDTSHPRLSAGASRLVRSSGTQNADQLPSSCTAGGYLQRVKLLLAKPDASVFLCKGRLLWRLALAYGPTEMLIRVHLGPSSGKEAVASSRYLSGNLWSYDASEEDVDALLGRCVKNDGEELFWWPPLDIYQRFIGRVGEWSALDEDWFMRRSAEIDRVRPRPTALSYHQWLGKFQRLAKTEGQLLLESRAEDVRVHLLKEGEQPWSGSRAWDVEDELSASG